MTSYRYAPEVKEIAVELIETVEQHQNLSEAYIVYLFRDKAPVSNGRIVLGRARRISGLPAFLARSTGTTDLLEDPRPFFVIEISHNTWQGLDEPKRRALVDHELCHLVVDTDVDPDAEPKLSTRGHDFEEFSQILKRHGLWSTASERVGAVVAEQLAIDDIVDYVQGLDELPPRTRPRRRCGMSVEAEFPRLAWLAGIPGGRHPGAVHHLYVEAGAVLEQLAVARALVFELAAAFRECTGEYAQELCADVLAAADVIGASSALPVPGQPVGEGGIPVPPSSTTHRISICPDEDCPDCIALASARVVDMLAARRRKVGA